MLLPLPTPRFNTTFGTECQTNTFQNQCLMMLASVQNYGLQSHYEIQASCQNRHHPGPIASASLLSLQPMSVQIFLSTSSSVPIPQALLPLLQVDISPSYF